MTEQKTALLVGSSFSAAPLFFALKKQGLHVSVCGNLKSDPCHQYADVSYYIDYSIPEELLKLVELHQFDYIIPSCNDYAYMSCAAVAEKHQYHGFDDLDTARIVHTKSTFRLFTEAHSFPVPQFVECLSGQPSKIDNLKFPLLVKPVDSFSGRGVTKITDLSGAQQALQEGMAASRSGAVVVEEFIEGSLHSHSAFIENNKVVYDFFVDEFCTVYPYQVNCSNHPSALHPSVRNRIHTEINRLANTLKLSNGLLHTQVIVNGNDFWIIECMRRGPGDLYGSMIELSTGIDYADLYIRAFINMDFPKGLIKTSSKPIGRHTITKSEPLINFSFSYNIPAKEVNIVQLKESGEKLNEAPFDKLAIIFAEFDDEKTMFLTSPKFADLIEVRQLGELS